MHAEVLLFTLLVLGGLRYTCAQDRDLRVGAFNIQVFGVTKASKPDVMDMLTKIVRRYDLLLIQEIRDSSGQAIIQLLNMVNEGQTEDMGFEMLLSERLGRTVSKEQYAFFYRPGQGISVADHYIYDDGDEALNTENTTVDFFEREPMVVSFRSNTSVLSTFTLAGIHIDPDEAVDEINALYDVFFNARHLLGNHDVMVLGDLNADCTYVSSTKWVNISLKTDPSFTWWIGNDVDTTVKHTHCAYDRFISLGSGWSNGIVSNSAKVYEYDADPLLGTINSSFAADISDHYPIEFLLKRRSYAVYIISDVYVVLENPDVSLSQTTLYDVVGLSVHDTNGNIVGRIRSETSKEIALTEALDVISLEFAKLQEEVRMTVDPVRNRWGGRQNCILAVTIKADQHLQDAVELIFQSKNVQYNKQYF